jgi:hypothetical protein
MKQRSKEKDGEERGAKVWVERAFRGQAVGRAKIVS